MIEISVAAIGAISIIIPAILIYRTNMAKLKKEIKRKEEEIEQHINEKYEHKIKAQILDRVLDFPSFNLIKEAVDSLFETTRADRFLILIAINGKIDFNMVSVIFEQHKNSQYKVNAIARYKSLSIDSEYQAMLKKSEKYGTVTAITKKMNECLLKDIYIIEGVVESDIRHVLRVPIDNDNDLLVYSSLSTHEKNGFTKIGKRKADIIYDSQIKIILKDILT